MTIGAILRLSCCSLPAAGVRARPQAKAPVERSPSTCRRLPPARHRAVASSTRRSPEPVEELPPAPARAAAPRQPRSRPPASRKAGAEARKAPRSPTPDAPPPPGAAAAQTADGRTVRRPNRQIRVDRSTVRTKLLDTVDFSGLSNDRARRLQRARRIHPAGRGRAEGPNWCSPGRREKAETLAKLADGARLARAENGTCRHRN